MAVFQVILYWAGFSVTVALVLIPADVAVEFQLVAQILLAAVAAILFFFVADSLYSKDGRLALALKLLASVLGIAAFLFFNFYTELVQAAIAVVVAIGALIETLGSIDSFRRKRDTRYSFDAVVKALLIFAWVGFLAGVASALVTKELTSIVLASGLLLFGSLTLCFAGYTAIALAEGRPFQVESHWGGLGGGLGGWRISQPIILLVLTITFSGSAATVFMKAMPTVESPMDDASTEVARESDASTNGDGSGPGVEGLSIGEESTSGEQPTGATDSDMSSEDRLASST